MFKFLFGCCFLGTVLAYKYDTKYIQVPLDHFNFISNETFPLRYLINDTYWTTGGPIFFYTGNEGDVTMFAEATGLMWEQAPNFNALIVFAEHRYYGDSLPFGNDSFNEPKYSGYLSSSQALADYVYLIAYLQNGYGVTEKLPVIAFGGSYGGMLTAWIRMKYPAVIDGALASSAPIWQFTNMTTCTSFNEVVTHAFKLASTNCPTAIKRSWTSINDLGKTATGRKWLSQNFKLCAALNSTDDVEDFKDWIIEVYGNVAMVNYPYAADYLAPLPGHPVKAMCAKINKTTKKDKVLLQSLFKALTVYFNYTGTADCLDTDEDATPSLGDYGWDYQSCTEMVMPMCDDGKSDMFEASPWDMTSISDECYEEFSVRPQVNLVRDLYGGKDISWASNIIFSNGLLDPWSAGGVLQNVSDTAIAVVIADSAHHLDLRATHKKDPADITAARKFYVETFKKWIAEAKSKTKKAEIPNNIESRQVV